LLQENNESYLDSEMIKLLALNQTLEFLLKYGVNTRKYG